ncbi:tripartite tricarboxylate transporter TctB family protein [Aeromonas enteropelogenes]|uniref:tripartite tricarboxylate transporter TctB family protein n=1 Tax=Aeromonas enteropelogenes TaxID=29489 RepID=UPI0005A933C9|nr:tripartite tricarboxylate transporter TctB family protein [Aeromonas enteropelogenes]UBH51981.1 tripartite tricarboxylate transporter TctB family protein [Aeromonas enteropelogenes]
MSDRLFALCWLLLSLGAAALAWQLHSEYSYEPVGPRPFPLVISLLMAGCALLLLKRTPDLASWPERPALLRIAAMVLALFSYGWGFEWLGFPLATTLLTVVVGRLFGASWRAALIAGPLLGISLFYAFDRLLDVTLPLGAWLA